MNPQQMNPGAKALSDLVKQFRALGHPSDEAIKMVEAMVRVLAESGPKMIESLRGIAANAAQSAEAKLEAGLADVAAIKLQAYDKLECGSQEVIHLAMLWVWDSDRAAGPRCPEHRTPLLYQRLRLFNGTSLGTPQAAYGDEWATDSGEERFLFLGPNGTFRCPSDALLWPQIGELGTKLGTIRANATDLLRHKLGTAPVGEGT